MKHAREFKVGAAIIVAVVLFFIGIRFFEDVPVFRGTYELYTEVENAQGLTTGNSVRVQGVNVGSVEAVEVDETSRVVRVQFHVDREVTVPEGSTTVIAGIAALNGVRVDLNLGPATNERIQPGGFVPSVETRSMFDLTEKAPQLIDRLETILASAGSSFEQVNTLLQNAEPELTQTLRSVRGTSESLDATLRSQQARIASTLENVEAISADLRTFTTGNRDSLQMLVSTMNRSFERLNTNLVALDTASQALNRILVGVERGDGTVGQLLNDPELYLKLDSTLTALNRLMADFQADPGRYLEQMRLIDVF